jgi:membrane-bound serine protease (ClpP class)
MSIPLIAALTTVAVVLLFITYKVFESAKKQTTVLQFAGQVALAIYEINLGKEGFVLFHGEHWKAKSKATIVPGQEVMIISREGLTLIVEPTRNLSKDLADENKRSGEPGNGT